MKKLVSFIVVLLIPAVSFGLTCEQIFNAATDPTNGYLRIGFNAYDSTANTKIVSEEALCGQWFDSTNYAINVAPYGGFDFTGDSTVTGDFDVTGDTGLTGALDVTGAVTFDGGTFTFNDDSGDYDFRVESDGNANLIVTDAANDRIGLGVAAPGVFLDISGVIETNGGNVVINQDSGDYDFTVETDNQASAFVVNAGEDGVFFSAGIHRKYLGISGSSYTIAAANKADYYFAVDSSGNPGAGVYGIALDTTAFSAGREIVILDVVDASSNNILITPSSGTVNGAANITISTQYGSSTLVFDGTNFWIIGGDL